MTTISIRRLHTRLRVPGDGGQAAGRLKRLLGEVLDSALEAALLRRGVDGHGELCIRSLQAQVRLDLGAPDAALVAQWAQQMAEAVARAPDGAGFVHYGSRAHALADLTLSACAGDLSRAWAWHGLGLWPAAEAVAAGDAPAQVLRALTAHPSLAVAALAELARRPARFARWWRTLAPAQLEALAQAVLHGAGAGPASAPPPSTAWVPMAGALPPWLAAGALARLAEAHAVAHGTARAALPGWPASRVLALLAIAEAQPALLLARGPILDQLLDDLGTRWAARAQAARPPAPGTRRAPEAPPGASLAPASESATSVPRRTSAATAFGGLLFLLNLAPELGWPQRWLDDPVLAGGGMRQGLYRLALDLVPAAGRHDPAVLAFAGLAPGSERPAAAREEPDPAYERALAAVRGELIAALRARLADPLADDAALLAWLCRRRGEIRADPGWLELHLPLDAVRTGLRAAGLDLDPGWLPWLGLVIRFVYE